MPPPVPSSEKAVPLADRMKFFPSFLECEKAKDDLKETDKITNSVLCAGVFFVLMGFPLACINREAVQLTGAFGHLQAIVCAKAGCLLEFGVVPALVAGLCCQLAAASKTISVDTSSAGDKAAFGKLVKMATVLLGFVMAVFYVFAADMYGTGLSISSVFIVIQLTAANFFVALLDEMMQKGNGLYSAGSSIPLWMGVTSAERIMSSFVQFWGKGDDMVGSIPNVPYALWTSSNKFFGLVSTVYRPEQPNLVQGLFSVITAGLVLYLLRWRSELTVTSTRARGMGQKYPVNVMYTYNIPLFYFIGFTAMALFTSQILAVAFPNPLTRKFGQWSDGVPVSGLISYICPPPNLKSVLQDPFRVVFYAVYVITFCGIMSKTWIEVAGACSRDLAKSLRDQNIVVRGFRDTALTGIVDRYVPTSAMLSGMFLGAIVVIGDFGGSYQSGVGVVLCVTVAWNIQEEMLKTNPQMMQMAKQRMMGAQGAGN